MKYSVLCYNFNNYEQFREIPFSTQSSDVEYVYVTDNSNIKSTGWKIINDPEIANLRPFEKCYAVRFNPFKYVSNDICVYLDGSCQIYEPLDALVKRYILSKMDIAVMVHPARSTMWEEYITWITARHYNSSQAFKCLMYMEHNGYDIMQYKGLYQGGMRITKNSDKCNLVDAETLNILTKLQTTHDIERIDQTIYSYVLNHIYQEVSLFPFTQSWIQSKYIKICGHKSSKNIRYNPNNDKSIGWIRNKLLPVDVEHAH